MLVSKNSENKPLVNFISAISKKPDSFTSSNILDLLKIDYHRNKTLFSTSKLDLSTISITLSSESKEVYLSGLNLNT
jgi:hypothetical protein